MPGIIGFRDLIPNDQQTDLLVRMAGALKSQPGDAVDIYSDEMIHLGRVRLAISSAFPQPAWSADHRIGVVVAGEIFDTEKHVDALRTAGYSLEDGNTAQLIVGLYQTHGIRFVENLNGAFAIAIWDGLEQKLILANDRLGYEPLYYYHGRERFLFGSGVRSLLADSTIPRAVNYQAIAQFLTFDHVLGVHTFVENVQLLPPGSILTFADNQVSTQTYWKVEFPEHYTKQSEKEYIEEMIFLLRQAMKRQQPHLPAGILLSGGLDSRYVLAFLWEMHLSVPMMAITFGNPGCDDLRYARELAQHLHTPHLYYPLRPGYLAERAEQGIQLTDGMENVVHMHTLDTLTEQVSHAPILYKGFLGDALAGYFSFRDLPARYAVDDMVQMFLERYPIVFNPAVHPQLFTPDIVNLLQDSVMETTRSEFSSTDPSRLAADSFFYFDIHHRQRRLTLNGVQMVRSQAIVRTPLYDNDVVDFMLRVPQGYRLERHLFKQAFIRAFPELAKVPYTETGYPMMSCRRELFMRLDEHIRWRLRAAGFSKVPVPQKRHYASYNQWMRGELRSWAENILLSDRALGRGIFNPMFVRKLVDEHMAGQNNYQKLGALISIELWHRMYMD
jgi:asparagine synthase (glutamine-hydrolysing)